MDTKSNKKNLCGKKEGITEPLGNLAAERRDFKEGKIALHLEWEDRQMSGKMHRQLAEYGDFETNKLVDEQCPSFAK